MTDIRQTPEKLLDPFQLQTRYINKMNKLLPPGYKLELFPGKRGRSRSQSNRDSSRSLRRRTRGRQKERTWGRASSEWTDKDWGLKIGGEPARKCYEILQNLKKHTLAVPFLQAVDPVALNLPDYLEIVTDPIDLSTVERNLKAGIYTNAEEFAVDVRRIWLNSFKYNAIHTDIYYMTLEMATYFEKMYKEVEGMLFSTDTDITVVPQDKSNVKNYMNRPMNAQERKILGANIQKLNKEQLRHICEIVTGGKVNESTVSFNVLKIPHRVCREIEKYIKLSSLAGHHANRQRSKSARRIYQQEQSRKEKISKKRYLYDEMEYY